MDGFVSAPQQALRKTILSVFPPAPKPRGVIAPDFIYPKMDVIDDVVMADDAASESESEVEDLPPPRRMPSGRPGRRAAQKKISYRLVSARGRTEVRCEASDVASLIFGKFQIYKNDGCSFSTPDGPSRRCRRPLYRSKVAIRPLFDSTHTRV